MENVILIGWIVLAVALFSGVMKLLVKNVR